jgi:hypothetical protein
MRNRFGSPGVAGGSRGEESREIGERKETDDTRTNNEIPNAERWVCSRILEMVLLF